MIRILLIRHGNNDLLGRTLYGRMPGVHLNLEGLSQAHLLARVLTQSYSLSEVVSSPLERAVETASPIAEAQKVAFTIDEQLTEVDFGLWTGKSFSELNELEDWRLYILQRSLKWPPGGESLMEVQARAWRAVNRIIRRYAATEEATVAVITHGDVIRSLLLMILGMSIDHISRLEILPASVSELFVGSNELIVRSLNQVFKTSGPG